MLVSRSEVFSQYPATDATSIMPPTLRFGVEKLMHEMSTHQQVYIAIGRHIERRITAQHCVSEQALGRKSENMPSRDEAHFHTGKVTTTYPTSNRRVETFISLVTFNPQKVQYS